MCIDRLLRSATGFGAPVTTAVDGLSGKPDLGVE